jgi:hypothetical protein
VCQVIVDDKKIVYWFVCWIFQKCQWLKGL